MVGEHREWKVYDECGHDHDHDGPDNPDVVDVEGVGYVCSDGLLYSVCEQCHTHDGECHECTPEEQAWPCDAAVAQARVKALEEGNAELRSVVLNIQVRTVDRDAPSALKAIWGMAERALAGKEVDGGS